MSKSKLWTKNFLVDAVVNFFVYLVYYLLMVMIAGYAMDNLHASPSQAGLAVGIFVIGALVSRIYAGSIIERTGRKKMLYIGLLIYVVATVLYFRVEGMMFLFLVRFLHGIGFGATSTATATIAANLVPKDRQGEGISYYAMSTTMASAIGPFLAMYLSQNASFYTILVLCIVALAACFGAVFFLKVSEETEVKEEAGNKKQFSISNFIEYKALPISIIGAVIGLSYSSIVSFLSSYVKEIGLAEAGSFFFLAYSIAILVSRPATGKLFDSKNENYVMYPAFVLFAVGLFTLSQAHQGIVLLSAAALIGLGFGTFLSSGQAIAVKSAPSHRIGLATSTFLAITDTGVGIGPFLLGILVPVVGFGGLYKAMAGVTIVSLVLYYFLHGRKVSQSNSVRMAGKALISRNGAYAED
ncbi:MAG: MFS transporter [Muricomes sp.]